MPERSLSVSDIIATMILTIIFEFLVKLHKWNKFCVKLFGYIDFYNLYLAARIEDDSYAVGIIKSILIFFQGK